MNQVALRMLLQDRAKFAGVLFGITFTSFLVTFAMSYFCGFMTRAFALVAENPAVAVWVMDPAVQAPEQTINMPDAALARIRSVEGVAYAAPLVLGGVAARFADGRFQQFEVIGVDDATLEGAPTLQGRRPVALRAHNAVIADAGGTEGKLQTPVLARDRWPRDGVHLTAPTRQLATGDELLANDQLVRVLGVSDTLPRFPPRPLLYATIPNALRILPAEARTLSFVLVTGDGRIAPRALADRVSRQTGLRARAAQDFREDIVRWFLVNSEDVGDIAAMLTLAMTMGFGVTGVMLYMFTLEHQTQYAVLRALGAPPATLRRMVAVQAAVCAVIGLGLGLGACALAGLAVTRLGFPFRMLWYAPVAGIVGVLLVCLAAGALSLRPVLRLQPAEVFAGAR